MGTLTADKATRLAKIAALFASDMDGERAAAARKFHEALVADGLTLGDVLGTRPAPMSKPFHQYQAGHCLRTLRALSDWEQSFLRAMQRSKAPSDRQLECLTALYQQAVEAKDD